MTPRIAIIGGGISGLTAAHRLRAELGPRAELLLFDQADRIGGELRTVPLAGGHLDLGAEAFLARRPEVLDLAAELGIREEVVHPSGASSLIRADGATRAIPGGTFMGVPTSADAVGDVLSEAGAAAVRAESELPPVPWDGSDVPAGALLRERLGDEVVDRLVDPLLGGVYGGGADGLGLRATMPALAGALDAGARTITEAAARAAGSSTAGGQPRPGPVFGALRTGYQQLLERLSTASAATAQLGTAVRGLRRTGTGWQLETGPAPRGEHVDVDGVVLAVPAPAAARLLQGVAEEAARQLSGIALASMVLVGLALPPGAVLPERSGVLIARGERHADGTPFTAKAFTFSSVKWPHLRGARGEPLLRASIGRTESDPELRFTDAELVRRVRGDLAEVAGVHAEPVETAVVRWGGGLPQYGAGHADLVAAVRHRVAELDGLEIAGSWLDGVGVPACVSAGERAARALVRDRVAG
ncbi:protoporphyrinogen oxidase [Salinifilum ghardaiensis]